MSQGYRSSSLVKSNVFFINTDLYLVKFQIYLNSIHFYLNRCDVLRTIELLQKP